MLIGEYNHVLDSKNRVIVPQKFREMDNQPGAAWSEFVLTRGPENCILVYTPAEWETLKKALFGKVALAGATRRQFQRMLYGGGADGKCDRQGRIVIPEKLRDFAGLTREVTWIGAGDHAELWNTERWKAYEADSMELFQETFDKMAADLDGSSTPGPEAPDNP